MRLTGEVNALNEAIRRLISEGGDGKLLRRYENPNNPRDTSWNGKRKKLLDDEAQYEAAQKGEEPKDPKMGLSVTARSSYCLYSAVRYQTQRGALATTAP